MSEEIEHKTDEYILALKNQLAADGFQWEPVVIALKRIRPEVIKYKDPLVVKVLRLAYEHIEENEAFEIEYFEEDDELQEDMTDFEYFVELLKGRRNASNREELKAYRDLLYESA